MIRGVLPLPYHLGSHLPNWQIPVVDSLAF
uniref:Uncharacterized protein n=1 Tax=Setaria italica TaxID=4555 RepID=K3YF85_SETIT